MLSATQSAFLRPLLFAMAIFIDPDWSSRKRMQPGCFESTGIS